MMRLSRQFDADSVARTDIAVRYHDAHDPGLAHQIAGWVPVQRRRHQAFLKTVDLDAGVAEPGDFDDRTLAEMEPRAGWQGEEIDAFRGDVLAEIGGPHRKT